MLVAGNDNDSIGRYLRGLHEALMLSGRASYRVVDPQGLLGDALPDGNVLSTTEDAQSFVEALCAGEVEVHIVVFTSIAQTLASLSAATSGALAGYIAGERCVGKTSLVCASEAWRVRAVYDDWYKVVSSHGNGIWCGSGFSDQTMFRFARPLAEYRQPADRSDGFLVMRGNITCVRLLEATAEPKEEGR